MTHIPHSGHIQQPLHSPVEAVVRAIVLELDLAVERRQWTDFEIREILGRRPPDKVLRDGNTCYMNPCVDLTLIALNRLAERGQNPILVVEEVKGGNYSFNRMHVAIELPNHGSPWYIDFASRNRVILGRGEYESHARQDGIEVVQLVRLKDGIGWDTSFEAIVQGRFKPHGYKIDRQIEQLVQDNTPENFQRYMAELGGNRSLYIELNPE
jgi:hypothetical protein